MIINLPDVEIQSYEAELAAFHEELNDSLTGETGWLSVVGLFWLDEGSHTVGSATANAIVLPPVDVPALVGTIELQQGVVNFQRTTFKPVLVDKHSIQEVILLPDNEEGGPTVVSISTVSFYVIKRGERYGIRVRDTNSPARLGFQGRRWFDTDETYRVDGRFTAYPTSRKVTVDSALGVPLQMDNPGYVDFTLYGQPLRLQAFSTDTNDLWFIFKDETTGVTTYGSGRFLKASLNSEGQIALDFNRAYNPPCAFSPYATCPMPLRENILPISINVGEKSPK